MDTFRTELRVGVRRLLARPGLTVAAVVTLALGMGANAAVFGLVRGVLFEPLPYAAPDRLVLIWHPGSESDQTWLSAREWAEYRLATRSFEQLAAWTDLAVNLTGDSEPERVPAARVTGNTFETLGASALYGRTFTMAEDARGRDDVVVIGHSLWQRRFGGAVDLVGQSIRVNGRPRTVLGIMPPDFRLPLDYREDRPTELWVPATIDEANAGSFGSREFFIVGRLRAGVSAAAASTDLVRVSKEWEARGYINNTDRRLDRDAVPLASLLTRTLKPALLVLVGAVGFILLIACANVANLLLARSDARRRDVATQAALGATRVRIARELLVESGLLACAGAVLGMALAYGLLAGTLALTPVNLIRMRDISVDGAVLLFSALLALLTTVLAGLAPALELARVNLIGTMNAGGRGAAAVVRKRLRHALVIAQTALSVILVIGAGLLVRSFIEMRRIDLGFDPASILTFRVSLPQAGYAPAQAAEFYRQLTERLARLPGVQHAAAVRVLPLSNTIGDWTITIEGKTFPEGSNPNGDWQVVTPGYFEAMGIELLRGRFLNAADHATGDLSVVIDENMAARYWPGEDALGKRFHLGTRDQPWLTIVGITHPVRHNAVVEEPRTEMFLSHAQFPRAAGNAPLSMTIVLKTIGDPLSFVTAARAEVRALDPALPIAEVRTMDRVAAAALAQPRFLTILLGAFALLALVLAAIGLYGVIAFLAGRRQAEIGLRMALGATRLDVVRMVLGEGVLLAAAGVLVGALGAAWLTRFLSGLLYDVQRLDPFTFAVVPVVLILVATLAAWLPARRAAATSPLAALRNG